MADDPAGADENILSRQEAAAAWEAVVSDLEATARQYRADGWEALAIHPGDVTVRSGGKRVGLDLLVPDDEFQRLQSLLSEAVAFDSYQVYSAHRDGVMFVVVAMEDDRTKTTVVYPAYYDPGDPDTADLLKHARREGELRSYLRVLGGEFVEFTLEDPDPFVPRNENS